MSAPSSTYFYNQQIASYLLQFIRIFGNFQVKTGIGPDGSDVYITVPVRYSDMSRQVANILKNNSSNVINSCPFMTCHITGINMDSNRRQDPNFVESQLVNERYFENGQYTHDEGQRYTVKKYMPVPYVLSMELDMWTSNTNQKLQLLEQILVLFNPALDLQTSTNPLDWTALTTVELEDSITWTERAIPAGTDDALEICKMTFRLPIWLNPPAKIKQQHIINTIAANIHIGKSQEIPVWNGDDQLVIRQFITIKNYSIKVEGNVITLLDYDGKEQDANGKIHSWKHLLEKYGTYREGISQIQLKTTTDMQDYITNIIGTIQLIDAKPNKLLWALDTDTLPANTLPDINAIIDPHRAFPGNILPPAILGQRYLLLDDIGGATKAWGNLNASANDIIEYNGQQWIVSFNSLENPNVEYVRNANVKSLKQFKWTGKRWAETIDGEYYPGFWWLSL